MTVQKIDLKTLQIDADTLRTLDTIAEWQSASQGFRLFSGFCARGAGCPIGPCCVAVQHEGSDA